MLYVGYLLHFGVLLSMEVAVEPIYGVMLFSGTLIALASLGWQQL
jgi:hypothetical protein